MEKAITATRGRCSGGSRLRHWSCPHAVSDGEREVVDRAARTRATARLRRGRCRRQRAARRHAPERKRRTRRSARWRRRALRHRLTPARYQGRTPAGARDAATTSLHLGVGRSRWNSARSGRALVGRVVVAGGQLLRPVRSRWSGRAMATTRRVLSAPQERRAVASRAPSRVMTSSSPPRSRDERAQHLPLRYLRRRGFWAVTRSSCIKRSRAAPTVAWVPASAPRPRSRSGSSRRRGGSRRRRRRHQGRHRRPDDPRRRSRCSS